MSKLTDLKPQRRNANRHTPRGIGQLERSIQEDGWIGAITVAADGETFDGSARIEVGAQAGFEDAIVVESDGSKPVVVKRTDIPSADDPRAMRLGIAANRVAELNLDWDAAMLAELAEETDLSGLFSGEELIALLADAQHIEPGGGGDEFDPSVQEGPTRTALGDLWVIGGVHRLIVGDCTDPVVVERLMEGGRAALMVTDPPYGVEYEPTWRHARGLIQSPRVGAVTNDGHADWRDAWSLFEGHIAYVWHADLRAKHAIESLEACDFELRAQIIWAKQQLVIGRGHYHFQHEPCWYAVRKSTTAEWSGDHKQTTLWQIDNPLKSGEETTEHGTQKPIECMARPMRNHGKAGDIVYDPFLGSGTTLIAAHRTGRRCYGCEIEPRYADVILRRAESEGLTCERVDG